MAAVHFKHENSKLYALEESSSAQPELLWYSSDDYRQFRKEAAKERITSEKKECDSSFFRREFILHLLHLQSEQRSLGIPSDPKGLHAVSRACSKAATARAHETALRVARDVGTSLIDPRNLHQEHRHVRWRGRISAAGVFPVCHKTVLLSSSTGMAGATGVGRRRRPMSSPTA